MPEIIAQAELAWTVLQHHDLRMIVEAAHPERMRFGRPKTLGERHLIRRINGLIAEEYHQVVVESLLDFGENIVI